MRLTLTRPDDWHLHLRDGEMLLVTLAHSARQFARAIVMPNLKPPVTTVALALAYRARILAALPQGASFEPLMTLYLTDHTLPEEIQKARDCGCIHGVKLYPAGATTNSAAGLTRIENASAVFAAMESAGLPLLVHGEVTDPKVDIFDREKVFIDTLLAPLLGRFPRLKVVLEHATTREAVEFVRDRHRAGAPIAATLTAHHLLYNRNALFQEGLRPHRYCLPVLKRETHRLALLEAATSGHPAFFLGTDSAPHPQNAKEAACACAGCYTASHALELYAQAFESAGALDKLEAFASFNGPDFYGLPRNREKITLCKKTQDVPRGYPVAQTNIVPLCAGETLDWQMLSGSEET
ncbi:MAG: dihydroorotase [Zoogloeaceae bacterium]|jgi:dihydroorotase|nr:dihydroorotase [Zoogloeaceae bacterium]